MQRSTTDLKRPTSAFAQSSTIAIFFILVAMCVVTAVLAPAFTKMSNILSTVRQFSTIAIAGIGVSMIIITGGIDLSIGSVYGLAGVVAAMLMKGGMPLIPSLLVSIIISGFVGMCSGLMVVYFKLPPFIATLGTMQIARSICIILTKGYPVSKVGEGFTILGQGDMLGIPNPIWVMVAVAIVFAVFFNKTTTGRRIFALGGNEEATRISGINTKFLKVLVYTLGAVMAGLAGIITASKLGVGQPTAGTGFEMDAIAAVVIGGTSLLGGEGTVIGTILGAAIIGVLRNALVLLSIDSNFQMLIMGCVILAAVTIDQLRKNH